jgi:membrane protein required for colicin V production
MNTADYLILTVLALSTVFSLMRGIVSEVMSLAVWALALWISSTTSGAFAAQFLSSVEPVAVRMGSAYIAVFLLVLVAGGIVTWLIRKLVAKTGLSSTDRLLGAAFGFSRGLLILFSVVLFAGFTEIPKQPIWRESILLPTIVPLTRTLSAYLPASVRNYLHFPVFDAPPAERIEPPTANDAPSNKTPPNSL